MKFARSLSFLTAMCVVGLLAFTVPAGGETETTTEVISKKKAPGAKANKNKQAHVHLKSDIKKLQAVKRDLASRPLNYGGHREKALRNIDSALRELRILEKEVGKKNKGKGKKKIK